MADQRHLSDIPLTDTLASLGISHVEHNGISRKLYRGDVCLGAFTASEAWAYVQGLKPAEDLTPEGIQLVIPGAERVQAPSVKQMELF